jgi:hypothetical protein
VKNPNTEIRLIFIAVGQEAVRRLGPKPKHITFEKIGQSVRALQVTGWRIHQFHSIKEIMEAARSLPNKATVSTAKILFASEAARWKPVRTTAVDTADDLETVLDDGDHVALLEDAYGFNRRAA